VLGERAGFGRPPPGVESVQDAVAQAPFPLHGKSIHPRRGIGPLRNAQLTSVVPTGTISLIAGTASGIEPIFAHAYARRILGRELAGDDPLFERLARQRGSCSRDERDQGHSRRTRPAACLAVDTEGPTARSRGTFGTLLGTPVPARWSTRQAAVRTGEVTHAGCR
jgi:hypothetical protein